MSVFFLIPSQGSNYDISAGRFSFPSNSVLVVEYPVPPRCIGIISFSFNFVFVNGWIISFFMSFSTHSIVTTSPLEINKGTE